MGRNTFSPAAACPAADSIFDSVQSVATARTRWCACSTVTNVPFYTTHASHYLLKCCDRVALPLLSLGFLAPEARRAVDAARLCGCPAALLLLPLPLCVLAPRLLTLSHHKNTGYFFHPRIFISFLYSLPFFRSTACVKRTRTNPNQTHQTSLARGTVVANHTNNLCAHPIGYRKRNIVFMNFS